MGFAVVPDLGEKMVEVQGEVVRIQEQFTLLQVAHQAAADILGRRRAVVRVEADVIQVAAEHQAPGAVLPGGNGVAFDWRILAQAEPGLDYMLSGGLDAGNVGAALAEASPPGIDVSSGVESAPGEKDPLLIEAFFRAVRAAGGRSAA